MIDKITIKGARQHNLKNIDVFLDKIFYYIHII